MFHQDELVRNYLEQASQRYAELRVQQHRQSDELERVMSPRAQAKETQSSLTTARMTQAPQTLPSFERKNTLLLTGKSKFYTMSYEDHCRTPSPSRDQPSTTVEQYHTIATDRFPAYRPEEKAKPIKAKVNARKSKSVVGNLQYNITVPQSEPSSLRYDQSSTKVTDTLSNADTNHNSIFWPIQMQCLGVENCPHPILPHTGNLCAACFQAKRYSIAVQYPTALTKL